MRRLSRWELHRRQHGTHDLKGHSSATGTMLRAALLPRQNPLMLVLCCRQNGGMDGGARCEQEYGEAAGHFRERVCACLVGGAEWRTDHRVFAALCPHLLRVRSGRLAGRVCGLVVGGCACFGHAHGAGGEGAGGHNAQRSCGRVGAKCHLQNSSDGESGDARSLEF